MAFNFEKLEVYQLALEYYEMAFSLANKLPSFEKYILGKELCKSAISISANIAEGSVYGKKQFSHFLDISRGSVREIVNCLRIILKRGYVGNEEFQTHYQFLERLSKMLSGLKTSIQ